MREIQTISREHARRLTIAHQGLSKSRGLGSGENAVYKAIDQLGYVQIDTISVVERAHHHVIWSRVGDYKQQHLLALQTRKRQIFEYWAHAAAYLPVAEFRYTLPTMQYFREHHDRWPRSDAKTKAFVLDRIRSEGPLMSRDFQAHKDGKSNGWWDWKPAKLALQRLFFEGEILVSHRQGFQRVYDLAERVLGSVTDTAMPNEEEYLRFLVTRTLRSHGIATPKSISSQRMTANRALDDILKQMCEEGFIVRVAVKGLENITSYVLAESLDQTFRIAKHVHILSPFDNLVIQRKRLAQLFDFDYQIECYVPKAKRRFGYFSLPVLYGTQFIARFDFKADRKNKILNLQNAVFEEGFTPDDRCLQELKRSVLAFAAFNQCEVIRTHAVSPGNYRNLLSHISG